MAAQLCLLQGHQRVNPIPEAERDDAFWQIKCESIKAGNVEAILAIFWDLLYVWSSPWFPHTESTSRFLLPLQYCMPPASPARFPVTVPTFYKGVQPTCFPVTSKPPYTAKSPCLHNTPPRGGYITHLLTLIGAQGFENLSLWVC
jgi:hypothetical protein